MPYALGLDFGTLSCRALLLNLEDPTDIREGNCAFQHGVMSEQLADGTRLEGGDWALQDATDYLLAARVAIDACLPVGDPRRSDIAGIGIDFTASSPLPCSADGAPLSRQHPREPHAYVKLWKHHRAEPFVERIQDQPGSKRWLRSYGGQLSCEWLVPKALELAESAPSLWDQTDVFVEAGDWVVQQPPGHRAGELTEAGAALLGLSEARGVPVSAATIDAHSGLLGMGIRDAGAFGMIMGTSSCQLFLGREEKVIPGVMGVVRDGILPGLFAYEAGQAAVGDLFALFLRTLCPLGEADHVELSARAAEIPPGSHGHLVLDWVNGNRSVLLEPSLSGAVLGLTLDSKPHEVYRACLEATAFGCKVILETIRDRGVEFDQVVACGGLTRNELLMQIHADVLELPVQVAAVEETVALGAAIYGAMAAGHAIDGLTPPPARIYQPDLATRRAYGEVYEDYLVLHDHFGRRTDLLKRLRNRRNR